MAVGLSLALALFAGAVGAQAADPAAGAQTSQAAHYGPVLPPPAAAPPAPAKSEVTGCASTPPSTDPNEIVVCVQRPQGYRLNPDVLEAKRERRSAGRPTPRETLKNDSCKTVGPMGCRELGGINLLAAASTLAEMADRLSKGKEIGSMFVTDHEPSEYDLYVEAKHRREAREAEAAAKAKAAAKVKVGRAAAAEPDRQVANPDR